MVTGPVSNVATTSPKRMIRTSTPVQSASPEAMPMIFPCERLRRKRPFISMTFFREEMGTGQAIGSGPTAALTKSKAQMKAPAIETAASRAETSEKIIGVTPFCHPRWVMHSLMQGACQMEYFQ